MKATLRENMLITMGARAASMESAGYIHLPEGSRGEDHLANFVVKIVDAYLVLSNDSDECFDDFIEVALEREYQNKEVD